MSNSSSTNNGLSLGGVLGVVFVTLKLCGVIHWSWWWVTSPFWGAPALVLVFMGIVFGFAALCLICSRMLDK